MNLPQKSEIAKVLQSAARRYGHDLAQVEAHFDTIRLYFHTERAFPRRDSQGRLHLNANVDGHHIQIELDSNDKLTGIGCATCHKFSRSKSTVCPAATAVAAYFVAQQVGISIEAPEPAPLPAPIDPIDAAVESILIENAPASDAFRQRLASAVELVKAGITQFPHYQTSFEPFGYYGVRRCNCNDARHRSLYAPKIGTVCKHTLSQLLAERIRQQREAVADRKLASDLARNRPTAHGNAGATALPASASDNGRIEDMLGYDDGGGRAVAQQIAEVRAANWWAKPDPINKSAAGAGRSQFRARYGRG